MQGIRLANAPCSWGTLEFAGVGSAPIGYRQMLDELKATGYEGTELGDWEYMPTDPAQLRDALACRDISLRGAFVPVPLTDQSAHPEGIRVAVRTATLLAAAGDAGDPPVLVLADENGTDPVRRTNAGRITPAMGISEAGWDVVAHGATRIAQAVRAETGLKTVFHHHCAGFVETPDEIAQLMMRTDPDDLGLVFDTGHYAFAAGSRGAVLEGLDRFRDRITYMHFKDCSDDIAADVHAAQENYFEAVGRGVFCELGQGGVDFPAVVQYLATMGYRGWIVVEQDVLPGMGSPKESAARNRAYLRAIGL